MEMIENANLLEDYLKNSNFQYFFGVSNLFYLQKIYLNEETRRQLDYILKNFIFLIKYSFFNLFLLFFYTIFIQFLRQEQFI